MRKSHSITIKDIARIAGVSHSTVSRALNDSRLINKDTRKRIQSIARDLNFEFNASARSLSIRRTGVIAVIYQTNLDTFGTSLYASQLFLELRHQLEHYQLDAILLEAYNPETGDSNISRLIRQNKVDGFLLVHTDIREEDYLHILESRLPVVQLHSNSRFFPIEKLDYFLPDHESGGRLAGEHLLESGCRRILTLTVDPDRNGEYAGRTRGFRQALAGAGHELEEEQIIKVGCSFQSGYDLVKKRPELFREADGVFAQSDILAFGCFCALRESGFSIPGDLRLLGYDDAPVCTLTKPHLSTIHQPREELSRMACSRIHQLVSGSAEEERVQVCVEPVLVRRGTT